MLKHADYNYFAWSLQQPTRSANMARYGKKSGKVVEAAMKKYKKGTLESGKSGKQVKSRQQAIAIGLSEARKKGIKVPRKTKS
jgi:hypothetical protein